MKKFINIFILVLLTAQFVFGEYVFFIDPANPHTKNRFLVLKEENKTDPLWNNLGLYSSTSFKYSNPNGIADSAGLVARELSTWAKPDNKQDIILMGFSLGGLVTREVYQQLGADQSRVKGMITLGTPQNGSRLADPLWLVTASAGAAAYAVVMATSGAASALYNLLYFALRGDVPVDSAESSEDGKSIQQSIMREVINNNSTALSQKDAQEVSQMHEYIDYLSSSKASGKMRGRPLQELGMQYGFPLIDIIMGHFQSSAGDQRILELWNNVLTGGEGHSARQMQPGSTYLRSLNSAESVAREQQLRRVAIMNKNGNIFETTYYPLSEQVVINYLITIAALTAAGAATCWIPGVGAGFFIAAGTHLVSLGMFQSIPGLVSWMHVGEWYAHGRHEVLVPYDDEYWVSATPAQYEASTNEKRIFLFRVEEKMILNQELRGYNDEKDLHITNEHVSHADVPIPDAELRSVSRKVEAADELNDSYYRAVMHINGTGVE
jgi:hypothetical protein